MDDERYTHLWEQGCYALVIGIVITLVAAWVAGRMEVVSGLMFGFFVLWQVVRGLIIKRYFWNIKDEKVSFWSLCCAFLFALFSYWLGGQGS